MHTCIPKHVVYSDKHIIEEIVRQVGHHLLLLLLLLPGAELL
jgi:hypothetical protein